MSQSNGSHEVAQIRQKMQLLRAQLDKDVEQVQFGAKTLLDWHYYVRNYPWACVGVSALVGYLVVPRRLEIVSPDIKTLEKLAKRNRVVVETNPEAAAKGGLIGTAFSFLSGLVLRTAMAQLGTQVAHAMDQMSDRKQHGNGSDGANRRSRREG